MPLTEKKRRFVAAIEKGCNQTEAAIQAGYSENGARQAASRLMRDDSVVAALDRRRKVNEAKTEAKDSGRQLNVMEMSKMFSDPEQFLLALMNDLAEDVRLRFEAAKVLMPYKHARVGEVGKKEARQEAGKAKAQSGRFATPEPPRYLQ